MGVCRRESSGVADTSCVAFWGWENIVTVLFQVNRVNILKSDGSVLSYI